MIEILKRLQYQNENNADKRRREHEGDERVARDLENAAYENDPIGTLLLKRYRLNPIGFFLISILGIACLQGLSLLLYWRIPTLSAQSLFEYLSLWHQLSMYWVVFPAMLAFYPWLTHSPARIFGCLYKDVIAMNSKQKARELLTSGRDSVGAHISDKGWAYVALAIVIATTVYWVVTGVAKDDWIVGQLDLKVYMCIQMPFRVVLGYMLLLSLTKVIVIIRGLFSLLSEKELSKSENEIVHLRLLHQDGYGGLGFIRHYAVRLSVLVSIIGLYIVLLLYASIFFHNVTITESLASDAGLWFGMIAYVLVAPTVFFLTLYPAKRALNYSRTQLLHRISEQVEKELEYEPIKIDLKRDSVPNDSADKLGKLYTLHELVYKNPSGGFDFSSIGKFMVTYVFPIVTLVVSLLLL